MIKNKKLFSDNPTPLRNQRTKEIGISILILVVLPVINRLIVSAGKQSALYNSLSRLAWPENLLWLIYIWGVLNMGCFLYTNEMAMRAGGYTRFWCRVVLYSGVASTLIMTVGVSIPAYVDRGDYYLLLQNIHTIIAAIGFVGLFFVLVLISATLFKRNVRQAILSVLIDAFVLIVGVFGALKVNDPTSYCRISASVQILLLELFNVHALLNYFGMTLFPNNGGKNYSVENPPVCENESLPQKEILK